MKDTDFLYPFGDRSRNRIDVTVDFKAGLELFGQGVLDRIVGEIVV